MPENLAQKLEKRGWAPEDIESTMDKIYSESAQKKGEVYRQKLNPLIYWMVLVVAIMVNLVFSVVMIPFFMVLTSIQLYVIIGVMGLIVGLIFNLLIRELENVDYKHHIMGGIALPIIAEVTIIIMVRIANSFSTAIQSNIHQNSVIISIVYVLSFMTPYLIYKTYDVMNERKWKKKKGPLPPAPNPEQSQMIATQPPVQPGL